MELKEDIEGIEKIIGEAIGEGSMCWSQIPKGIFDSTNASRIVKETSLRIFNLKENKPCKPLLGCATTRELIEEIKARIEVDGNLDYKTIDRD